ncbi:MAG: flagellar biosynthetic protein FliR [Rhodospirillaceae bacterium]|nr:flagellar biosynthetic protein FliR [Rhodospirillaceae bacterium]
MLEQYLAINIYQLLIVFARLSVVFVMMPGVSAAYVPARLRLLVALLVAVLVHPLVRSTLPPQPDTPAALVWLVVSEVLVGAFLGALIQIVMAAIELARQLISSATGLTNALTDDPVTEEQSAIIIGMRNLVAVVMIFITGTHQFMIMAIVDSYNLLVPSAPLFTRDILLVASKLLDQSFYMGIRLAAPFLVFEMVFQVTSGVMARQSPQLNVFFVVLPGKIALGLAILMVSLPTIILVFLHFFDNNLHGLLSPTGTVGPVR